MPQDEKGVSLQVVTLLLCASPFRHRILRDLDEVLARIVEPGLRTFTLPSRIRADGTFLATILLEILIPTIPAGGLHFGFDCTAFGQAHLSELVLSVLDFGLWVANQGRDPPDWLIDAGLRGGAASWTPFKLSVARLNNINEYEQTFFECYPV